MLYRRGKQGTYWYKVKLYGRTLHKSTHTASRGKARAMAKIYRVQLEAQIVFGNYEQRFGHEWRVDR